MVGYDGTEFDLEERKFRASMKFTNERMGPNEPLLNFYNRFILQFDNCVTIDVPYVGRIGGCKAFLLEAGCGETRATVQRKHETCP